MELDPITYQILAEGNPDAPWIVLLALGIGVVLAGFLYLLERD